MNNTRISYIDMLKALGIILVVIGHASLKNPLLIKTIYSFHMPLFFFTSGYLYNYSKYKSNQRIFIISRFKSIVIPYIAGCLFAFWYGSKFAAIPTSPKASIIAILKSNGKGFNTFNTPMWFLPCLFATLVVFSFILSRLHKFSIHKQLLVFTFLAMVGSIIIKKHYIPLNLPWGIDLIPITMFFCFLGFYYRKIENYISAKKNIILLVLSILIFISGLHFNGRIDMMGRYFNNILIFYPTAISGIYITIQIAQLLSYKNVPIFTRIFKYAGANSLMILLLHPWSFSVSTKTLAYIMRNILHITNYNFKEIFYSWFIYIYILSGVLLPLLVTFLFIERNTLQWIFKGSNKK
ncbi:acyltransferase family protein [Clostridium cellulovorans]|uniref:Acyltransferase 3 n=1 Tax=Clostridium cellulovorans (strain ATCC 35296 / DSM 3052 / OCM 3 / 743B) TaxID=573061 RepID=D9SWB1_CLOC7|nr:acyltransferase family protein [Clostridium cellulovorans]ADL51255.1 acyltransferase 3 [Clostridium cellulovorans 743B]